MWWVTNPPYEYFDNKKGLGDNENSFQQKPYVTPSINGSYSIKYVLPALVPEMAESYSKLDTLAMVRVLEKLKEV